MTWQGDRGILQPPQAGEPQEVSSQEAAEEDSKARLAEDSKVRLAEVRRRLEQSWHEMSAAERVRAHVQVEGKVMWEERYDQQGNVY